MHACISGSYSFLVSQVLNLRQFTMTLIKERGDLAMQIQSRDVSHVCCIISLAIHSKISHGNEVFVFVCREEQCMYRGDM